MEHPHIKIENEPRFIDRQSGGGHPIFGGGTLTASPTNTSTNNKVN